MFLRGLYKREMFNALIGEEAVRPLNNILADIDKIALNSSPPLQAPLSTQSARFYSVRMLVQSRKNSKADRRVISTIYIRSFDDGTTEIPNVSVTNYITEVDIARRNKEDKSFPTFLIPLEGLGPISDTLVGRISQNSITVGIELDTILSIQTPRELDDQYTKQLANAINAYSRVFYLVERIKKKTYGDRSAVVYRYRESKRPALIIPQGTTLSQDLYPYTGSGLGEDSRIEVEVTT